MLARGEGGPSDMSGGVALIDKAAKAGNSNAKKFKKELQSLFLNQDFAVGFGYADGRIDAPGAPHSSAASVELLVNGDSLGPKTLATQEHTAGAARP